MRTSQDAQLAAIDNRLAALEADKDKEKPGPTKERGDGKANTDAADDDDDGNDDDDDDDGSRPLHPERPRRLSALPPPPNRPAPKLPGSPPPPYPPTSTDEDYETTSESIPVTVRQRRPQMVSATAVRFANPLATDLGQEPTYSVVITRPEQLDGGGYSPMHALSGSSMAPDEYPASTIPSTTFTQAVRITF